MTHAHPVRLTRFGHALGDRVVTNDALAERFGVPADEIERRSGIRERGYVSGGATSDLVVSAARRCLADAVDPADIDAVIVATATPDRMCPSCAALVHHKLGTRRAFAFDLHAACGGFVYALEVATALMDARGYARVLVAGAETMSTLVDPDDRKTALVFGDGAGVALLEREGPGLRVVDTLCGLDSDRTLDVTVPGGGSLDPGARSGPRAIRFASRRVARDGVDLLCHAAEALLDRHGLTSDELDLVVPHQPNGRMLEAARQRLGVVPERWASNVATVGNTSAASIPILLSQLSKGGGFQGRVLLAAVGAGYTYGAALLEAEP